VSDVEEGQSASPDSRPGTGTEASRREYWKRNRRLIAVLLTIWFVVSYGLAIFLAEPTSGMRIGQLPAGFWWAHQGSMFVFVGLIFFYAWRMDRLDREYDVHEDED